MALARGGLQATYKARLYFKQCPGRFAGGWAKLVVDDDTLPEWKARFSSCGPISLVFCDNCSPCLAVQGKYHEAGLLHLRAIDVWEETVGLDHPILADILHNRAGLLKGQVRELLCCRDEPCDKLRCLCDARFWISTTNRHHR